MKKCVIFKGSSGTKTISKTFKLIHLKYNNLKDIIIDDKVALDVYLENIKQIGKQKHNILLSGNFTNNEIEIFKDICIDLGYKYLIADSKSNDKEIREFVYGDVNIKLEQSAMAVIIYHDEIVVTYEKIYTDTAISLPKGHVEKNETFIDAAIREAKEEAGITVTHDDFYCECKPYATHYITPNDTEIVKIIYPIVFQIHERRETKIKEKRIEKVVYMKIDEFLKVCSYKNIKEFVSKIKF